MASLHTVVLSSMQKDLAISKRTDASSNPLSSMSRNLMISIFLLACVHHMLAKELEVTKKGDDANEGSAERPFLTVSAAAPLAQPGDTITVHAGVYRERINPPRGGDSDDKRIVYRAAPGETVEIAGSELVRNWTRVEDDVWKVHLPNTTFGRFNPYSDLIHGDWFDPKGRPHHTGAVYLDGIWLPEAAGLETLLYPDQADTGYLLNLASLAPGEDATNHPATLADQFASRQGTQTAPCSEGGQCLGFVVDGNWARYESLGHARRADRAAPGRAGWRAAGNLPNRADRRLAVVGFLPGRHQADQRFADPLPSLQGPRSRSLLVGSRGRDANHPLGPVPGH